MSAIKLKNNTPETTNISSRYLDETMILDYEAASIQSLIKSRQWKELSTYQKIGAAYNYVRDEIKFGYNKSDDIPASQVLSDGYGQ